MSGRAAVIQGTVPTRTVRVLSMTAVPASTSAFPPLAHGSLPCRLRSDSVLGIQCVVPFGVWLVGPCAAVCLHWFVRSILGCVQVFLPYIQVTHHTIRSLRTGRIPRLCPCGGGRRYALHGVLASLHRRLTVSWASTFRTPFAAVQSPATHGSRHLVAVVDLVFQNSNKIHLLEQFCFKFLLLARLADGWSCSSTFDNALPICSVGSAVTNSSVVSTQPLTYATFCIMIPGGFANVDAVRLEDCEDVVRHPLQSCGGFQSTHRFL